MTQTTLAILGRFEGDRGKAVDYCCEIMRTYPDLHEEYRDHCDKIMNYGEAK